MMKMESTYSVRFDPVVKRNKDFVINMATMPILSFTRRYDRFKDMSFLFHGCHSSHVLTVKVSKISSPDDKRLRN